MTTQLGLSKELKVNFKRLAAAVGYLNSEERAGSTEVEQVWQSRMEGKCDYDWPS